MKRNGHNPLVATYRLQLSSEFTFDMAAAITDYLAALGISHVYCSPCLQSARGSTHGYDIVEPRRVSDERGGEEGFGRLCRSVAEGGMDMVLDIVPNHMAASPSENLLWRDVLAKGQASQRAEFFDINWDPPEASLRGRVLLPVLASPLEEMLQSGQIRLAIRDGQIVCDCNGMELPLAEESIQPRTEESTASEYIDKVNADHLRLKGMLYVQHYRLAHWRDADTRINYRRFFSIAGLVAVRVEHDDVFEFVHELILKWVNAGLVAGLRVDHIDGLRDPGGYLKRLRRECPRQWIVVEKILAHGERLPETWPVQGTTGYDFLNQVNGLFVDPDGEAGLTSMYGRFTGETTDWPTVFSACRLELLDNSFGSEFSRLSGLLEQVAGRHEAAAGLESDRLRQALREVIGAFGVYRTYVGPDSPADQAQERQIDQAIEAARRRRPDLPARTWDFLADLMKLRLTGDAEADFVQRLQQLTGAVAAKGVEDTALYRFNRLASLNEVGGDPGRFGTSVQEFHLFCQHLQSHWPQTMLASSTHDTKRSEDVIARMALLSEIPGNWAQAVDRWSRVLSRLRRDDMPTRNDEYLFYQTAFGAWPISPERLSAYMIKAVREARLRTTWQDPCGAYEDALQEFVTSALADREFVGDLEAFLEPLRRPAMANSLAATLLKCTAPGVPDFYQGSELWSLSLVDPDNRRPVDYAQGQSVLAQLAQASAEEVWANPGPGRPKMLVILRALALRRRRPELFDERGDYEPLHAVGQRTDHVVAFTRGRAALAVVPRLSLRLAGDWIDTTIPLPPGEWVDQFTRRAFIGNTPLSQLLEVFPVSLLVKEGA